MAITRDQLSSLTNTGSIGAGTTFTITFPSLPAAGSSVIVAIGINGQSVTTVKDNGTSQSTFTQDVSKVGTTNHISYLYRADGISLPGSGSYTITVTIGGSGSGVSVSAGAASYLGKGAGGPVATNSGTATGTSITTGSVTPAMGGSLFTATFQDNSSGSADNVTVTNGNFTSRLVQNNGSTGQVYGFADAIEAGTSADACTWSVATSATYSSAIAVYSTAGTTANAGLATAVGAALQIPAPAGLATATGTALQIPARAGLATAAGTALSPQFGTPTAGIGHAVGTAQPPVPNVIALAGLATAKGTALQIPAPAGLATAVSTALSPVPVVKPPAGLAHGSGTAVQPRPVILRFPQHLGAVLAEDTAETVLSLASLSATFTLQDYRATLVLANYGATLTGWTMLGPVPLNLSEFNDVTISIAVTNNGAALNLTGATLNLLLKTAAGTPDANALVFSSGGGSPAITITNAVGGLAVATIPNTDLDAETYNFYRLDVVSSGLTNTTVFGPITWTTL